MFRRIDIDKEPFTLSYRTIEGFPWIRIDAKKFVWEEVFFEGNLLTSAFSCMGRRLSRERTRNRFMDDKVDRTNRLAFEVEIDGQLLRDFFTWEKDEVIQHENGNEELILTLGYELMPIKIHVHTLVDGSSFLTRWLEVENCDTRPHAVSGIFPFCGIIGNPRWEGTHSIAEQRFSKYELGFFRSNYLVGEGEFTFEELQQGSRAFINTKANYNPRMFILRHDKAVENIILDMECTAHAHVEFNYITDNELLVRSNMPTKPVVQVRMGIARRSTYRFVEPGEKVTSPVVHFGGVYGDLDVCVNEHHEHLRRSVLPEHPADKRNLVELNHSGYGYNEHMKTQYLLNEVDLAVAAGAETFLVDAGWFGRFPDSWGKSMGEWTEHEILNGGLGEAFDYARSFGLKCGLWVAIEEAGAESHVRTQHPEWMLTQGKQTLGNLDITNPEVEEHLFQTLSGVIEKYKLDLFRIDGGYNQAADKAKGGYLENQSWKYYENLYKLVERIRDRFPGILFENCSGGGGRIDLGMMRRFHYTQMSDNWAPAEQVRILNGLTLAYPPVNVQSMIGAMNDDTSDLDFMLRTAVLSHFVISGIAPTLDTCSPIVLDKWRHAIELHKKYVNPMIYDCSVYHHTPFQVYKHYGDWVVLEYVSQDKKTAVVGLFRLQECENPVFPFVSRGLSASKKYRVTWDNTGESAIYNGADLLSDGFKVRVPGKLMSELLIIEEVE